MKKEKVEFNNVFGFKPCFVPDSDCKKYIEEKNNVTIELKSVELIQEEHFGQIRIYEVEYIEV